jgi:hypothetical protein
MALARVQAASGYQSSAVSSVTMGISPPVIGNGIIVVVTIDRFNSAIPYLCTDNRGNGYFRTAFKDGVGANTTIFHCPAITATTIDPNALVVTVTATGPVYWNILVIEVSGVNFGLDADGIATAYDTNAVVEVGPTPPLTVADTFQIAAYAKGADLTFTQVAPDVPDWLAEVKHTGSGGPPGSEIDSRVNPSGLGSVPLCHWDTSHVGEWSAVIVAFKAADAPIPIPPIPVAPAAATVKATAPTPRAFGVVGAVTHAVDPAIVRALPGLMPGAVPGSLAAPAALVKILPGAAQQVFQQYGGWVPGAKVTPGAVTVTWGYLTPLGRSAIVRCRALLPWIYGGQPVGSGAEWYKPIYGGTVGTYGEGTGDSCTCFNQPSNRRKPGDLLVLNLTWIGGTGSIPSILGWTLIGTCGNEGARVAMYWKRHGPSEPSQFTIYGLGSATQASGSWIETYGGGYSGDPVLSVTMNWGPAEKENTDSTLLSMPVAEPHSLILGLVGGRGSSAPNEGFYPAPLRTLEGNYPPTADFDLYKMRYRTQRGNVLAAYTTFDGIKIIPGDTGMWAFSAPWDKPFAAMVVALRSGVITPTPGHYYFAKKLAPLKGPLIGDWTHSWHAAQFGYPEEAAYELSPLRGDSGAYLPSYAVTNVYPPSDVLFYRWCTPPLAAQTLGGTLQICGESRAFFEHSDFQEPQPITANWRVHAYVTQGETTLVRTTVVNRWLSGQNLPFDYYDLLQSVTIPLAEVAVQSGDRLMIEFGVRVISAPTPPVEPEPLYDWAAIHFGAGATEGYYYGESYFYVPATLGIADAVPGTEQSYPGVPWLQFSQAPVELPKLPPPPNDAVSRALVIPSLPYTVELDTRTSRDPCRGVWFQYTPSADETILVHTLGGNYYCFLWLYKGQEPLRYLHHANNNNTQELLWGNNHSQTFGILHLTAGETYWLRVTSNGEWWSQAPSAGGRLRLTITHYTTEGQQNPENDDIYVPASGYLTLWRDGKLVDITGYWQLYITFTGFAIDFSRRPMTTEQGDINTGERLYMGFHYFNELAVCDVSNWNKRINSMYDALQRPPGVQNWNEHNASLMIDTSGRILTGWFGKGYLWATDQWNGQDRVWAFLDHPADYHPLLHAEQAYVRRVDAVAGCDYPSWDTPPDYELPFVAETIPVPYDKTGSNYIVTSLDGKTLYYTSAGFYVPVGSQTVHRWDLETNSPLPPLVTLPERGPNPGVRGMCILPDGGLLVCNGNAVDRVSASGTLVQTYTPYAETFPHQRQQLIDVHLTTDWTRFWVLDNSTNDLIEFALSGAQIRVVQTGLMGRAITQFAIYAEPPGVPPPISYGCTVDFPIDPGSGPACIPNFPVDPATGGGCVPSFPVDPE